MRQGAFKNLIRALYSTLSITIFGPLELFEEIGSFFQEHNVYLQDPLQCDRHVRYCNPHRLSSMDLERCIWTSDLGKITTQLFEVTSTVPIPEILDVIASTQELPEAEQPQSIRTALARYFHVHVNNLQPKYTDLRRLQASETSSVIHAKERRGMGAQRRTTRCLGICGAKNGRRVSTIAFLLHRRQSFNRILAQNLRESYFRLSSHRRARKLPRRYHC